jgi:hypothetical protein
MTYFAIMQAQIGKTITNVEPIENYQDQVIGFTLTFDDNTILRIHSRGSDEGSWVTVDLY